VPCYSHDEQILVHHYGSISCYWSISTDASFGFGETVLAIVTMTAPKSIYTSEQLHLTDDHFAEFERGIWHEPYLKIHRSTFLAAEYAGPVSAFVEHDLTIELLSSFSTLDIQTT
jgi:hypothetical protein